MKKKISNSIITVDIYNNTQYKYSKGRFSRLTKLKRSSDDIVVSYIANKDLSIEPVDLSPNLPEENLLDIITDKVYEELQLDPAVEHMIYPVKTAIHSTTVKYQALIIDKNQLTQKVNNLYKRIKYIDYLLPAPLLYKVLFEEKKLSSNDTFVFVHFGDYDTFVTFYHRGKYLYSKSIKFSLEQIYDRFCQLANEVLLTKEKFRDLLANSGLKSSDKTSRDLIVRVMNECFLTINDVMVYTKRAYDIDSFKAVYTSFDWGYLDGIELYVQNYLNLKGKPLVSVYSNEDPKLAVNPIHVLMKMSAEAFEKGSLDVVNITPYPKPKPFFKRASGQMISSFVLISLLGLAWPGYKAFVGVTYKSKNLLIESKARELTAEKHRYEKLISDKNNEIKRLDEAISKVRAIYEKKRGQVTNVYDKKFKYKLKSEQLALLTKILKEYDIQSRDIKVVNDLYFVGVESDDDKKITSFIKNTVKKFNKEIKSIEIEEITFDKNDNIYKGVLKVDFSKDVR